MQNKFNGTGVALITPFDINGNVDFPALSRIINNIIDGGCNYLVILGTTAETPCLSADEKRQVVDFAKKEINGRVPIVLGMSSNNTNNLLDDIRNCDFTGIDAILTASPYYNKPTQVGLYQHFAEIAQISPLPIILYNIPGRTGVNIMPETICSLARNFTNIIGVKEASGSVSQIMQVIANKPENFVVISGDDELTLPLISAGAVGVISVIANAFPQQWSAMVKAALDNDYLTARQLHYKFLPTVKNLFAEGNPAGVKAYLAQLGICQNVLRMPLVNVSNQLFSTISEDIQRFK